MAMHIPATAAAPGVAALTDTEIVGRVLAGESALFEILMRRHNQRVRAVRAVVKEEAVEDVAAGYINSFTHLHQFEERSRFPRG